VASKLAISLVLLLLITKDVVDSMLKNAPQRRPYQVAETIKCWIVDRHLKPGDRLPSESELMETLQVSKGTVRESTRVLEAQGLVETRTGPGGGAFVREMSEAKAVSLLSNYLFFKEISIKDIYQIRLALEPELAASLAGKVAASDMVRLRESLHSYADPADDSETERQQHLDSLHFHLMLAELAGGNQLLTFIIRFTIQVLSDLTIYHRLYEPVTHDLGQTGCRYHAEILDAIELGDAESAYNIMREHMLDAQQVMNQQEAQVRRGFLPEPLA
jgi:DNA-binding FadR family transcriptional regulator|tara:strand:- start:1819 stop:2640 length:822 start_codon:yes stop_codon:yes gene_type:complete